jgi:hypothetical protein
MFTKRVSIVLVASAMLLAVGIGPGVAHTTHALPPAQTGVTIPYSGNLTDEVGQPVADGAYDFTFALYAAESGGEPAWTEAHEGVAVQGGAFTVLLGSVTPLPKVALDGGVRWLEVEVRGPGEAEYTALIPRQKMSAPASVAQAGPTAPTALSCAHTHLYENWSGSNGGYTLRVENTSTGDGIRGISYATAADYGGVVGAAYASGGSGVYGLSLYNGRGVYGVSTSGDGVDGTTSATGMSGVYGHAVNSYGVTGRSDNTFGVQAVGGDSSWNDQIGDLVLGGNRGEIFSFGWAMNLFSNGDVYVDLDNDSNDTNSCLYIYRGDNTIVGQTCENGTKSAVLQTKDYGQRAVYTVESPEVWLEDFGTASLAAGKATVAFDSIFTETVNLEMDYHVFVTPLCQEPVLLFVTAKNGTGFTVQGVTLDNQPSNCAFDYRVVAKRLGLEDLRLEPVNSHKYEAQR